VRVWPLHNAVRLLASLARGDVDAGMGMTVEAFAMMMSTSVKAEIRYENVTGNGHVCLHL
jgi:hypothetical protein